MSEATIEFLLLFLVYDSAASPCTNTASAAASIPSMPCARRPAAMPQSTSPEPPVDSALLPVVLI